MRDIKAWIAKRNGMKEALNESSTTAQTNQVGNTREDVGSAERHVYGKQGSGIRRARRKKTRVQQEQVVPRVGRGGALDLGRTKILEMIECGRLEGQT
jgi:hypothetical protein